MRARKSGLIGLIALTALALVACSNSGSGSGKSEAGDGPVKVSMAIQPWLGYGAWYIAQDQGYFSQHGLEVTLQDFEADADMLAAMAAGKVDALNVASHGALLMLEQGVEAKIVLLLDAATSADAIITTGEITDVAGLKDQQIAYEEGATSELLLHWALQENGMTIADINKVPMGAAEAGSALIAGRVPAAVTYEPYITGAITQNPSVLVIYDAGAKEGLISDVLMISNKFAEENPDAVRALIRSWGSAVDFYHTVPEKGRSIISRDLGEDPSALESAFDGVVFYNLGDNMNLLAGEYLEVTLPTVQSVAITAGMLQGTVAPAEAIDTQFLPKSN